MADAMFADQLAPLPAPPKPGFTDVLAAAFGAAPNTSASYYKGIEAGSQVKLRSAQTESALAEADKRRAETLRQSQINDLIAKAQSNPTYQPSVSDLLTIATGAADLTHGQLYQQEATQRGTIADPNTPQATRLANMEAVTGKPVERYYQSGTGMQASQIAPTAAPTVTPVGQANIAADNALAAERARMQPNGIKVPTGYRLAADGQSLEPIVGGPHDPNASAPQSAREAIFTNRVLGGAAQSVAAMQNIMRMPVGASTGVLGIGGSPGKGIFESAKNALRNKLSDEEVQQYTVALSGLSRNLASIETQGLAPPGSFIGSLDALQLRSGDDELTKLVKLAEVRQTVEAGLDPLLNSPRVPPQTKQYAQTLLAKMQQTIPFTWEDVQALSSSPNDGMTLGQLLQAKGGTPQPGAAPAAGAPAAPSAAIRKTSNSNKPIVSHDGGKTWEYE